jgi:hypothetical protein
MPQELAIDEAELARRDQPTVRNANAVQRAVEISVPKIEKVDELWEAGREVVVLPDIALQKLGMIWEAIEDLRGGEGEALELANESRQ